MRPTRTLASLALLKTLWDQQRRDYLDTFVPLLVTVLRRAGFSEISDLRDVQAAFREEWGLNLPLHAIGTILHRARRKGYVHRYFRTMVVNVDRVRQDSNEAESLEQDRRVGKVLAELVAFAKGTFGEVLTIEEAEEAMLACLRDHDVDILFAARQGTVLPEGRATTRARFVFLKFVQDAFQNQPATFDFITSIAVGHILAGAVAYGEFDRFRGRLKGLHVFMDCHLLFSLLGVAETEEREALGELLATLKREDAKVFVFRHTFEETRVILENALRWLEKGDYDLRQGSKALRYFVETGFQPSDVESILSEMDSRIADAGIAIVAAPSPVDAKVYQIDEKKLHDKIVEAYKETNPKFSEEGKEDTLRRDVDSIAGVHRLRREARPSSVRQAGNVFVTGNYTLARASRLFEESEWGESFVIPVCLSDAFLGTILWLETPSQLTDLKRRRLLADCYAGMRPSVALLDKYLRAVERLKQEGRIGTDQYIALRSSRAARILLQEMTRGEPERVTAEMPVEILQRLADGARADERARGAKERQQLAEKLEGVTAQRESAERARVALEEAVGTRADALARILVNVGFWIIAIGSVVLWVLVALPDLAGFAKGTRIVLAIGAAVLSGATSMFKLDVWGAKKHMEKCLRKAVLGWLTSGRARD